jgi:hypothetical protein
MMRRFAFVLLAASTAAACGGSALIRAATSGDRPALDREIAAREKAGDLSNSQAAEVAKAVAEREIREAKGKDAVDRVRDVRACARELDSVLSERSKTHDEAGAEAALARIDSGELSLGSARDSWGDSDDAWRAVGARGLVRDDDGDARRHAFGDPAPGVRRSSLRAAQTARSLDDLDALSEAARLDPEPMIRSEAVRAIARLPAAPGVANRLRDLWQGGDDGVREDIAIAWASPDIFAVGGRDALVVLLASGHGPGVLEGAAAIVRGSYDNDKELSTTAAANLLRAVDAGSTHERLHAIAALRLDHPDMLAALEKASTDADPEVAIGALARLVDAPKDRADALSKLEAYAALAKGGPGGGVLAERAKIALATAGDLRVQAWIEADLKSGLAYERVGAVSDLAALGRVARGAPVLADVDAGVRTRAACAILIGARGH